jgi:peptidoglycan/LPS O-acetylase OafA/YrhL
MAILGAVVAVIGKIGGRIDIPIYRPTEAVPIPATPVSYLFRTGTCLVGLAAAYWIDRWQSRPPPAEPPPPPSAWKRFSPLLWLGQASMTVYMVHIDLVYNIWTYPLRHKLGPWAATAAIGVLTAAMVWLAYYRTARATKKQPRRTALPITSTATLATKSAPPLSAS